MADSIAPITLGGDWVDVYAATGIAAETPLLIQAKKGDVLFAVKSTEPTTEAGGVLSHEQWMQLDGQESGLWVRAYGGSAELYVQDAHGAVRGMPFSDPRVIDGDKAFTIQPYTELNVKNGVEYYLRVSYPEGAAIGSGVTKKVHFQTGSKTVLAKLRIIDYVGEEFKVDVFEGPTGVTGGTPITISNWNQQAPAASTVTATKDVTTTSDGTAMGNSEFLFGASATSGRILNSIPQGRERVLKKNTGYIVAFTNTSNSTSRLQYFLDWFEGDISVNIP